MQFSTPARHFDEAAIGYFTGQNHDEIGHGLGWKNGATIAREKPPDNGAVGGDSCTSVHRAFPQGSTGR
jgi:hypothetical protein